MNLQVEEWLRLKVPVEEQEFIVIVELVHCVVALAYAEKDPHPVPLESGEPFEFELEQPPKNPPLKVQCTQ